MQAVLSIMRKHKSGTIVNVSSMGDRIAFQLSSTYSGTKFGLEGLTESLSYEVEQFGIKVILIEPGVVLHTITHIEGMEENRITKTRVLMTGTLTGLLWKKNYLYTIVDYNDDYAEQTILLDFHRSAEKAQAPIYQKMIAAKKSYPKSAKVANEEKGVGEEEEA
jgi:short-subunit dehydrogenase